MRSAPKLPSVRVIPYQRSSAPFNMALDEYLLSLSLPVLRFYGWSSPALSFGRANCSAKDLNLEICRSREIEKVKRLTGGRTVLHHLELTYSFVCDSDLFPRSVLETYRFISQPLALGFQKLGLAPEMKPAAKSAGDSTICFQEASAYEITINGRKLVGSAQYRQRRRFLQHGSILLDVDWDLWKQAWNLPAASTLLEDRITSLKCELGYIPETDVLTQNLVEAFNSVFQTDSKVIPLSADELAQVEIIAGKYQWHGFKR